MKKDKLNIRKKRLRLNAFLHIARQTENDLKSKYGKKEIDKILEKIN